MNRRVWTGIGGGFAFGASAPVTLTVSNIAGVSFADKGNYEVMVDDFLSGGTWAFTSPSPPAQLSFDVGVGLGFDISAGGNWSWRR